MRHDHFSDIRENPIVKLKGIDLVQSFPWCDMHLLNLGTNFLKIEHIHTEISNY